MTLAAPARLKVLFAPEAPIAVIYRLGPAKKTQVWLWNTEVDEFTPGQWIDGRAQESSTLSPDGRYVITHVMRNNQVTVLSHPPFFAALALTEKAICLGGVHFTSDGSINSFFDEYPAPKDQCPILIHYWLEQVEDRPVDNQPLDSRNKHEATGFDQRGRTITLHEGCVGVVEHGETRWLIDLNPYRPEDVAAPDWALRW